MMTCSSGVASLQDLTAEPSVDPGHVLLDPLLANEHYLGSAVAYTC